MERDVFKRQAGAEVPGRLRTCLFTLNTELKQVSAISGNENKVLEHNQSLVAEGKW